MTSDIAPILGNKVEQSAENSAVYYQLYCQAQALIEELQEQLSLSRTLISHYQELAEVLQQRVSELEQQLVEYQDRLKSEQERSAQFRIALKRCQETKVQADTPELAIESWAVTEVASVPPISQPSPPPTQKRGLESLAAVKLPQFPPLRRR
jgi:exonuclease VII large subunit